MKFNCNWKLPINFISQSAKRKLLLNNPTDRTFENRWSRYKELGKKVPQAYRIYVEDTFLPCDAGDARIFVNVELDEETGLYYYGARYLDPRYSRWLSGDPALNDYIPKAPIDDDAKKHNENLSGMGGVFNVVNLQLYHYAGNNPVKYVDLDGRIVIPVPVPWFVPWSIPYMEPFIGPIDILPPIYVNPKDGFYRFVPDSNDSDIDWNYAPNGPDMSDPNSNPLGSDWEKKPGS